MADIMTYVKDKELRAWLKKFFTRVDKKRRARGEELYLNGQVQNFKQKAFGFTAEVEGTQIYKINAFFEETSQGELPNVDKSFFTCSCPDDVTYCKHIVATVLKWIVHDDRVKSLSERSAELKIQHKSIATRPTLERLERMAQKESSVHFEEHDGIYWPFKPTLPEVMARIQLMTKEKIRNQ